MGCGISLLCVYAPVILKCFFNTYFRCVRVVCLRACVCLRSCVCVCVCVCAVEGRPEE